MNKSSLRLILITIAVVGSVAYLILSGVKQTGLQYMSVTELATLSQPPKAGGFRLDGTVAAGTVDYDQRTPRLHFKMTDGKESIGVIYDGLMPDASRPDARSWWRERIATPTGRSWRRSL